MDTLFPLPDTAALYRALCDRDPAYEGRAWVGVRSTGIFCRLTCPARKPRPENCRWFDSPAAALGAGFRPCRRCHPLAPEAEGSAIVQRLLGAVTADPERRWSEADVAAMGLDPSTVRRAFRRHYGMTFLDLARQMRLGRGVRELAQGAPVIEAQIGAGFDSASGFRDAFARLFGHPPHALSAGGGGGGKGGGKGGGAGDAILSAAWIETPLGGMIAVTDERHLHQLEFTDRKALAPELRRLSAAAGGRIGLGRTAVTDATERQLDDFMAARSADFDLPLAMHGTAFYREVWAALRQIPAGQTISYGELARRVGRPTAARAVARANGMNQIAIVIPCHRVIGADGTLTGYAGGLWRKQALIAIERRLAA